MVLQATFQRGVGPKILQEVHPPGQPVPPYKDFVQEALVATVVRYYVFPMVHEHSKRAVRGLDDHDAGVEYGNVVASGRHLRKVEEEVEVM